MIAVAFSDEDGNKVFTTTGCGCCSVDLDDSDIDYIKDSLKSNVYVLKDACDLLGINMFDFINECLTENK